MNVLTMQDVRKSFGSLEVLKGISLTVGEGEAVSVIGPSGSGKSTLLNVLAGLEHVTSGEIVIAGKRLDGAEVIEIADQRGPVFQKLVKGIVEVL